MHIVVMGDSVAEGLGVAGRAYADVLGEDLRRAGVRARVTNLARSASQIGETAARLPEVLALRPDVVILAHGVTEAVVRPRPAALRMVPPRWRRVGWLDPRPYFSRRPAKSAYQRAESALRWRVKNLLIRAGGGATLTPAAEFERTLSGVTAALRRGGVRVVLLTHAGIDGRFYPGSPDSLDRYAEGAARVAGAAGEPDRVILCRAARLLDPRTDFFADGFHPNAAGHVKIARALGAALAAWGQEELGEKELGREERAA